MRPRRVFERDQMAADRADEAERIGRLGRVREQPALEFGIAPGARDDTGAVMRPDLRLARLDDPVEHGRIDIALLGQDRFERAHPELHVRQLDRKSTRLNSSHPSISYAVFCLKKKINTIKRK